MQIPPEKKALNAKRIQQILRSAKGPSAVAPHSPCGFTLTHVARVAPPVTDFIDEFRLMKYVMVDVELRRESPERGKWNEVTYL